MSTRNLIDEAASLPVEERARLVDSLLQSLNHPDPVIDEQWLGVAHQRLKDVRSGRVKTLSGDEVFESIRQRFS